MKRETEIIERERERERTPGIEPRIAALEAKELFLWRRYLCNSVLHFLTLFALHL